MKIKEADLIKNIGNDVSAALIFGEDESLLHSVVLGIKKKSIGYETFEFDAGIDGALTQASTEILTPSFFAERKSIVVRNIKKTQADEIIAIVKSNIAPNIVTFIHNGNLEASNKIRKTFEEGKNIACLGMYEDDPYTLAKIASESFAGYKITPEVPKLLAQHFKNNRSEMLSEIEKLKIYKIKTKEITMEDVATVDSDQNNSIFDAINIFFDKTPQKNVFEKLDAEGVSAISILNMIAKYALKLHGYIAIKATDEDLRKRGIFFKQVPVITKHMRLWTPQSLIKLCQKCEELESTMRFGADASYSMLINLGFAVCSQG